MNGTLERGFKSWAERTATSLRGELALTPFQPLDPRQLAEYLQVRLITPHQVDGITKEILHQLLVVDPWGWSALTLDQAESAIVIYNPKHSSGRQASDITHELAHIVLGHHPATMIMSPDGTMVMRSYNQKQEEEANWLAWALLLPREALLSLRRRRATVQDIANSFGVTEVLVQYRMRITGVESQVRSSNTWRQRRE
jgi:Zn-dependent peptidase ImmA (M78 family)